MKTRDELESELITLGIIGLNVAPKRAATEIRVLRWVLGIDEVAPSEAHRTRAIELSERLRDDRSVYVADPPPSKPEVT